MLITGTMNDYYDTVLKYGVDKSVVYNRITEEKPLLDTEANKINDFISLYTKSRFYNLFNSHYMKSVLVSIGNQKYFGFISNENVIPFRMKSNINNTKDENIFFIYNRESFEKYSEYYKGLTKLEPIKQLDVEFSSLIKPSSIAEYIDTLEQINSEINDKLDLTSVHIRLNSPVLILYYHYYNRYSNNYFAIKDAVLRNISFQSILDPYSTHQIIYNYLSGVIGSRENDLIEISDKDKIVSKGFDKKISFRHRK